MLSPLARLLHGVVVLLLLVAQVGTARPVLAQQAASTKVGSGISYELIGRWEPDRLNQILTVDTPKFAGIETPYSPARNAVRLYRVTYPSVVPEKGNKPILASGLLAVPDTGATTFPLVSYQHGTVYGKQEVPSFPEQSPETQLMLALFAGQGYALIGADYFGMGISTEPEGYLVKGAHQQATYDMLQASRLVFDDLKLKTTDLYLAGWSQGGFVTMAFLEKLEALGVPVKAAATASGPTDLFQVLNGFLHFPRPIDASWLNSIFILTVFAFENYYGVPGLARSFLADEYYDVSKAAYDRTPYDPTKITSDLHKLIKPDYFDATFFANSTFGRLATASTAYRWVVKTPVHNYYGETDEAITIGVGQLPMTYQRAMGNKQVTAITTGPTSHRGTFVRGAAQWKTWFDGLAKP